MEAGGGEHKVVGGGKVGRRLATVLPLEVRDQGVVWRAGRGVEERVWQPVAHVHQTEGGLAPNPFVLENLVLIWI